MPAPARRRRTRARAAPRSGAARAQARHARVRYVWAAHAWKSWASPPLPAPRPGPVAGRPADRRPAPRASDWTGCRQVSARPSLPAAGETLALARAAGPARRQRRQRQRTKSGARTTWHAPKNTHGKDEKVDHDGHHSVGRIQPIDRGRADQPKMAVRAGGPRWYWPVGESNSMMRPSCRGPTIDAATTSMVAMLWSTGRIAHGALVSVQSTQGVAGRGG